MVQFRFSTCVGLPEMATTCCVLVTPRTGGQHHRLAKTSRARRQNIVRDKFADAVVVKPIDRRATSVSSSIRATAQASGQGSVVWPAQLDGYGHVAVAIWITMQLGHRRQRRTGVGVKRLVRG
jgi:hypothetical protein